MSAEIRSYKPSDLQAIQKIHDANGIDYKLPNLDKFPVNKILEVDGKVRASYGMQLTLEAHLWLDKTGWADAESKWLTIKALDKEANEAAAVIGLESALCCLPPGYERFGKRLGDLGFTKIRPDWAVYTKRTGASNDNQ
jgi:hypothetical protein